MTAPFLVTCGQLGTESAGACTFLAEPRLPKGAGPVNVQASLWRSIAVFRVASLACAALLLVVDRANYAHLGWAWAVLAGWAAGNRGRAETPGG
jgi:hypothetical protein